MQKPSLGLIAFEDFARLRVAPMSEERVLMPNPSRLLLDYIRSNRERIEAEIGADISIISPVVELTPKGLQRVVNFIERYHFTGIIGLGQGGYNFEDDGSSVIEGRDGFQIEQVFRNTLKVDSKESPVVAKGRAELWTSELAKQIEFYADDNRIRVNRNTEIAAGKYYCNATGYHLAKAGKGIFVHMPFFGREQDAEQFWNNNLPDEIRNKLLSNGFSGYEDLNIMAIEESTEVFIVLAKNYLRVLSERGK